LAVLVTLLTGDTLVICGCLELEPNSCISFGLIEASLFVLFKAEAMHVTLSLVLIGLFKIACGLKVSIFKVVDPVSNNSFLVINDGQVTDTFSRYETRFGFDTRSFKGNHSRNDSNDKKNSHYGRTYLS
jgi:hypothetical protein